MPETVRNLVRGVLRKALHTGNVNAYIQQRQLAVKKRLYRQPITVPAFRDMLARLGFTKGRVIWVQSSWNEFFNVRAKPTEVIAMMREMLGPDGTLVMPTFPLDGDPQKVLEIDTVASSTGLLTEILRRTKGAERSIHLTSSACALGSAAQFLVTQHHQELFSWGPKSPYCRLRDVDARLVSFGLPPHAGVFTPMHVVECLLYDEVPFFRNVFDGTITYRWRRRTGEEGEHTFLRRVGRLSNASFGGHFPKQMSVRARISNLDAFAIDARFAISHALDLGRRGITLYAKSSIILKE